eukprot:3444906-Rhodomonas_salina.2
MRCPVLALRILLTPYAGAMRCPALTWRLAYASLPAYARGTLSPVLTSHMVLCHVREAKKRSAVVRYAMPCTDLRLARPGYSYHHRWHYR